MSTRGRRKLPADAKKTTINLSVSHDTKTKAAALADKAGLSVSEFICQYIDTEYARMERAARKAERREQERIAAQTPKLTPPVATWKDTSHVPAFARQSKC